MMVLKIQKLIPIEKVKFPVSIVQWKCNFSLEVNLCIFRHLRRWLFSKTPGSDILPINMRKQLHAVILIIFYICFIQSRKHNKKYFEILYMYMQRLNIDLNDMD